MKITRMLGEACPTGGTCPEVRDTDGGNVIVRGPVVTDPGILAELDMPAHEGALVIPRATIYGPQPILDVNQLGEWLAQNHTHDLFRLEVRDLYTVDSDGEDYHRYLSGDGEPNATAKQPWLDQLAADTAAGRIWRKVHLVRGALSDYERYEFEWGFAYNAEAGEQVRILELDDTRADRLAALGDFFVLDAEHVLRNLYDDVGRFLGAQVVYGDEAAALCAVVDWVWDAAEPFTNWWGSHPQFHRNQMAS